MSDQEQKNDAADEQDITRDRVFDALRLVIDPELHYNIVDLGLVYDATVRNKEVHVDMTLTSMGCPFGPVLIHESKMAVAALGAEPVSIDIVWDPPWSPDRMTDEAKLELGIDVDF